MQGSGRQRRVSHRILRLEIVGEGGVGRELARVFCTHQRRTVPLETCRVCPRGDAVDEGERAAVDCTVPGAPSDGPPRQAGDRADVGAVVSRGALALALDASVRTALAVMLDRERHALAVVDDSGALVGVVHEASLTRQEAAPARRSGDEPVLRAMSSPLAIHERTAVREALRLLAAANVREATVVDDDEVPLGVFRDLDGLRFVALTKARPGRRG